MFGHGAFSEYPISAAAAGSTPAPADLPASALTALGEPLELDTRAGGLLGALITEATPEDAAQGTALLGELLEPEPLDEGWWAALAEDALAADEQPQAQLDEVAELEQPEATWLYFAPPEDVEDAAQGTAVLGEVLEAAEPDEGLTLHCEIGDVESHYLIHVQSGELIEAVEPDEGLAQHGEIENVESDGLIQALFGEAVEVADDEEAGLTFFVAEDVVAVEDAAQGTALLGESLEPEPPDEGWWAALADDELAVDEQPQALLGELLEAAEPDEGVTLHGEIESVESDGLIQALFGEAVEVAEVEETGRLGLPVEEPEPVAGDGLPEAVGIFDGLMELDATEEGEWLSWQVIEVEAVSGVRGPTQAMAGGSAVRAVAESGLRRAGLGGSRATVNASGSANRVSVAASGNEAEEA